MKYIIVPVILVIMAVFFAECIATSPEMKVFYVPSLSPKTVTVGDCISYVNYSAKVHDMGPVNEITVAGFVQNVCQVPIKTLAIQGTFYDMDGNVIGSSTAAIDELLPNQTSAFAVQVDTTYKDLYTFNLKPVLSTPVKLF